MKRDDIIYSIVFVLIFLLTLNRLEGVSEKEKKDSKSKSTIGCYHAPIYVYDEEKKKYYRQDWCEYSNEPVYYDAIPVKSDRERR